MTTFLGYGYFALEQDADGNVSKWYQPGEDMGTVDSSTLMWAVGAGLRFDPMPTDEEITATLTAANEKAAENAPAPYDTAGTAVGPTVVPEQTGEADAAPAPTTTATGTTVPAGTAPAAPAHA